MRINTQGHGMIAMLVYIVAQHMRVSSRRSKQIAQTRVQLDLFSTFGQHRLITLLRSCSAQQDVAAYSLPLAFAVGCLHGDVGSLPVNIGAMALIVRTNHSENTISTAASDILDLAEDFEV
eukprot:5432668-Amphidinium_carterae.2